MPKKREPYKYNVGGAVVTSWKRIYRVNNCYVHKSGDYFVPVSVALLHKLVMAELQPIRKEVPHV